MSFCAPKFARESRAKSGGWGDVSLSLFADRHLTFHTLTCKRPVSYRGKNYRNDAGPSIPLSSAAVNKASEIQWNRRRADSLWHMLLEPRHLLYVCSAAPVWICTSVCVIVLGGFVGAVRAQHIVQFFAKRRGRRWHKVGGLFSAQGSVSQAWGFMSVQTQSWQWDRNDSDPANKSALTSDPVVLLSTDTNRENFHLAPD